MTEYCFLKKGRLYYMADYCGYTEHMSRAGLYEKSVAEAYHADSAANANGATVAVPIHECYWTIAELNAQIDTLTTIRDAKEKYMNETFTMKCNQCGKDYQASREAVYSPVQICRHCAEEMYKGNKNENHVQ